MAGYRLKIRSHVHRMLAASTVCLLLSKVEILYHQCIVNLFLSEQSTHIPIKLHQLLISSFSVIVWTHRQIPIKTILCFATLLVCMVLIVSCSDFNKPW